MAGKQRGRRGFGRIERRDSGRYRAAYIGEDQQLHRAAKTFDTRQDAEAWLSAQYTTIVQGQWIPPTSRKSTDSFGDFAAAWLAQRDLKPRTRQHYKMLLDRHILPTFAEIPISAISRDAVVVWHRKTAIDRPTLKAHAYGLLKAICGSAVRSGALVVNPCSIENASVAKRRSKTEPATLEELETVVNASPARYRSMVLLGAWCAMRFGELIELRRRDLDLKRGIIKIRRAAVKVDGTMLVGTPKSAAGIRDVAIPPHLLPPIKAHLDQWAQPGNDGLIFPSATGTHLLQPNMHRWFSVARNAAGRDDLRFHDLRHTGAVLAAQTGATLAELMGRLGHSTPGAAMRYQHAAKDRDSEIAKALSALID